MTHAVTGIQPGWSVHDPDGVDLGAVIRVDERSVWIRRGRIIKRAVEIPKALIRQAEEGYVELAVSLDELSA